MVRSEIRKLIEKSLKKLSWKIPDFSVEKPREPENGDYAANIAMLLLQKKDKSPMEKAETIKSEIMGCGKNFFDKIKIAEPGFINFFLSKEYLQKQLAVIFKRNEPIFLKIGKNQKINIEFISANPTGPLTLGNGRGGFCGDVLANVLEKAGYKVTREFYINDRGKQIGDLKKGLYKGEKRTASQIQKENQRVIEKKLKIKFDVWFSEKSLYKNKEIDRIFDFFKKNKLSYKKEGALWFRSTKFGDDKDRVLIKSSEEETYLASDAAYLKNKFERGFEKLIYLWGADHYGYFKTMRAVARALGYKKEQIDFIIMQMVRFFEKGKTSKMSKRSGFFIPLEKLVDEVGLDVARFFFLQRSPGSHLNFDFDLAKEKSQNNPVYYVQYAYARMSSILEKSEIKIQKSKFRNSELLTHQSELALIKQLIRFPEIIEDTVEDYQVQRIPNYVLELVSSFHKFYENCRILSEKKELSSARLDLVLSVQKILKEALDLMGLSAPKTM